MTPSSSPRTTSSPGGTALVPTAITLAGYKAENLRAIEATLVRLRRVFAQS